MLHTIIFLILGIILLIWGAEWLVRGASALARMIGVSPLAIGLTIVAYGTSSPELVVNISSVLSGQTDIALGNIVGSNVFNVLVILGACALILPLSVDAKLIRWDVPIMVFVSGLLFVFCLDHQLSAWEGGSLLALSVVYTWFCFSFSKKESKAVQDEFAKEFGDGAAGSKKPGGIFRHIVLIVLGLVLLVIGAKWLVNSSVELARHFGISELVIALTIVAAGTSLPEVATSILATIKGERDIAIGNVVGSNIFNILSIMGVSGIVAPQGLAINPSSVAVDIPFMIFVAVLCYPVFRSHAKITRWEGALFLVLYIGYTAYLVQSQH